MLSQTKDAIRRREERRARRAHRERVAQAPSGFGLASIGAFDRGWYDLVELATGIPVWGEWDGGRTLRDPLPIRPD